MPSQRSARSIIDEAIRENRQGMVLLYAIAVILVSTGAIALFAGMINGDSNISWAGAISSSLFFPAMLMAARIRRENIALRLLEAPLSRADTAKEASEALYHYFVQISSQPPSALPKRLKEESQI